MRMNQRTATVNTILSVLSEHDVNYELNGETPVKEVLTDTMLNQVRGILFTMFRSQKVEYRSSFQPKVDDDSELKKYISGLVNNWVRKAPEFNCGNKHQAKNPGSRAGIADEKVKEMKKLLSVTSDENARAIIQKAISDRISEIKIEKQQVEIDYTVIPKELLESLGI